MMQELLIDKKHDEARQGEAFSPFSSDATVYRRHFYIESYGCQMNFSDSEIVASILYEEGYGATRNYEEADLILLNTCSIREKSRANGTEAAVGVQERDGDRRRRSQTRYGRQKGKKPGRFSCCVGVV